jgi:predicted nucleic acid-binding protein
MAAILLDSTVVVDVLRGRPRTLARLDGLEASGDVPYVCAVTIEEVSCGMLPRERGAADVLFAGLAVAPLGMAEGRLAGFWRRTFRRRGKTLTQSDCLIAAAAVGIGGSLATGNPKDFPMPGLQVEHWPAGE